MTRLASHHRAVALVGQQHLLLERDPPAQDQHVQDRRAQRRQPRAVHQRQRRQLDEDRDVVRVAHVPERSRRDHAHRQRSHHAHVPVRAQRRDHPPAQHVGQHDQRQRRPADRRHERPLEKDHLRRRRDEHPGVQRHHEAEHRLALDLDPARAHRALVAPRHAHLEQPAGADRDQQGEEQLFAQLHCSSSISVVRPGPNAASTPWLPGGRRPPRQPLVQHEQHRCARLVAVGAQHVPRRLGRVARQAQPVLDGAQDLLATRVQHEAGELVPRQPGARRQPLDQRHDLALEQRRDVFRDHRVKAILVQVEPQRARRAREDVAQRLEHAHARAVAAPAEHRGRGAVAEQRARDQVGRRGVVALQAQARQLDGDDQHARVGEAAQEVVRARQRRRAADAAELGDRQPAHVAPEAERVDQVGVDRRDHDAGARRRDDQVDVAGRDARLGERPRRHLARQRGRVASIVLRGFGQRFADADLLHRVHAVAVVDLRVLEQRHDRVHAPAVDRQQSAQRARHLRLPRRVRGDRRRRRDNRRASGDPHGAKLRPGAISHKAEDHATSTWLARGAGGC